MTSVAIKRAFISTWDKSGLFNLAQFLDAAEIEIVSSGGTHKFFNDNGIKTISTEEVTGFPSMLQGRVKTLHPHIHAGILARADQMVELEQYGIAPFDLVCVNLYPFREWLRESTQNEKDKIDDQGIELIDIGGPTLLRSAAKNHHRVTVLSRPDQYDSFLRQSWKPSEGDGSIITITEFGEVYSNAHPLGDVSFSTTLKQRQQLAAQVFAEVSAYDRAIADWMGQSDFSAAHDS